MNFAGNAIRPTQNTEGVTMCDFCDGSGFVMASVQRVSEQTTAVCIGNIMGRTYPERVPCPFCLQTQIDRLNDVIDKLMAVTDTMADIDERLATRLSAVERKNSVMR